MFTLFIKEVRVLVSTNAAYPVLQDISGLTMYTYLLYRVKVLSLIGVSNYLHRQLLVNQNNVVH